MDEERPSLTAEGAAVMRALHQAPLHQPKILNDPISARLVDPLSDFYKSRVDLLERLPALTRQRLEATFVMRSRYAEDCLAEAFDKGALQYVLLGAGLDTFAYRQPSWANSLRIFEVDHPATQRWKRRRLADASVSVPDNVSFVPVDFEKVSLATALAQAGPDMSATTFFSMLGVSQYLTAVALDETLRLVLSAAARSEIVFSFVLPDHALPQEEANLAAKFTAQFAALGEPWLTRFEPSQLVAKLTAMGFSETIHLSSTDANQRYFCGRRDGLNAANLEQMMRAIV
jgi:methyltransferase (TIGR00027 family)